MLSTSAYSPRCVWLPLWGLQASHTGTWKNTIFCPTAHHISSKATQTPDDGNTWQIEIESPQFISHWPGKLRLSLRTKSSPWEDAGAATRNVDQSWEHFRLSWIIDREFQTKKSGLIRMLTGYLMSPPHGLGMGKCDSMWLFLASTR